jgi:hypothetical protein
MLTCVTPNPTVAGKPNVFFTANVAKFGLAQPMSMTQTRSVPAHPPPHNPTSRLASLPRPSTATHKRNL